MKLLITAALPYANGPLHFGHIAGAYLPADAFARFCRQRGDEVCFVCGSDEYGVAIALSAEREGHTPREHVDIYRAEQVKLFDQLAIDFTHFSRTTWPGHVVRVDQYFHDLLEAGYIEPKVTEQLYSEAEGRFLADRYVLGTCPKCGFEDARGDECPKCAASYEATDLEDPRSAMSDAPLSLKETRHWFLRLDKFKEPLLKWLDTKKWKSNTVHFVRRYIEDLRPRAITRDASWGVPVPLEEAAGKVIYVWFEAVIGYISATTEWSPEGWRDYWCDEETRLVQFLGKDNIPFHAVFFPAMTMGQKEPFKIVDDLVANEFLNLEGRQFSKSDKWTIDLDPFFERYSSDQIRYCLAANAPESSDSEFSWHDFQMRCNSELLGKYGNLVNRTLVFAQRYCDAKVPQAALDPQLAAKLDELRQQVAEAFAGYHLRRASQLVMEIAAVGNTYFDSQQPWKAAKREGGEVEVATTIRSCLECLRTLALASWPIVPHAAESIWSMLGLEGSILEEKELVCGAALPKPHVLFRKIEDEEIEQELATLKSTSC